METTWTRYIPTETPSDVAQIALDDLGPDAPDEAVTNWADEYAHEAVPAPEDDEDFDAALAAVAEIAAAVVAAYLEASAEASR